jgi:urease accessory protein
MERDSKRMRGERPFIFSSLRHGDGVQNIVDWLCEHVMFESAPANA